MLRIFQSKKGVSPLIATILLIAFAVALGSVVMNWGLSLNLGKPNDKCRSIEIKIRNIGASEFCFGGVGQNGYINFIIDNVGSADFTGLAIWIIGEKGTRIFDLDNIVIKRGSLFDKKDKEVSYDFSTYGNIKEVQFIPKIKVAETAEICTNNAVKAKKTAPCA